MKLRYIALAAALILSGCGGAENSSGGNESASQAVTTTSSAAGSAESEAVTSEPQGSSLKELSEELKAADSSILTGSALYGERLFEKNCQKLYLCRQSDLTDGFIVYNNGGGKVGEYLADVLLKSGNEVAVIEKDACRPQLWPFLRSYTLFTGRNTGRSLLFRGISAFCPTSFLIRIFTRHRFEQNLLHCRIQAYPHPEFLHAPLQCARHIGSVVREREHPRAPLFFRFHTGVLKKGHCVAIVKRSE